VIITADVTAYFRQRLLHFIPASNVFLLLLLLLLLLMMMMMMMMAAMALAE